LKKDEFMQIQINGEAVSIDAEQSSLQKALEAYGVTTNEHKGVAVAVDGEVVRRQDWPNKTLQGGENIEVIQARQGG
jgi:sulfur carrier protein